MAFFVAPQRHDEFQTLILTIMRRVKSDLDDALPFAMEPIVYDFQINSRGTWAELETGESAMMPPRYYTLQVPRMIAAGTSNLDGLRKADVDHFANHCRATDELIGVFRTMINHLFPVTRSAQDMASARWDEEAERIRMSNGFDADATRAAKGRLAPRSDWPGAVIVCPWTWRSMMWMTQT